MQKTEEADDLYTERDLLTARVIALESDLAAAEARERFMQTQMVRSNVEILTLTNDLVALGNLLRNEEQKCAKLGKDQKVIRQLLKEREIELKRSHAEIESLAKANENQLNYRLNVTLEKHKADKKLTSLRDLHEVVLKESIESKRRLELVNRRLGICQHSAVTAARILDEMKRRAIRLPASRKHLEIFPAISGRFMRQWQQFCRLLAHEGIFDSEEYLALHSDVAASGVNPLVHFLTRGLAEHRTLKKDAEL